MDLDVDSPMEKRAILATASCHEWFPALPGKGSSLK